MGSFPYRELISFSNLELVLIHPENPVDVQFILNRQVQFNLVCSLHSVANIFGN